MSSPFFIEHGRPEDPLLLCLHGIGSCANAFDDQASLADRCGVRVVAWDAPGYRHSPDPAEPFTLDDWADAAASLIEQLGGSGRPAHVLGVSWGGVTATRLALRHPALVRSLILADSSVGAGTKPEIAESMRGRAAALAEGGDEFARSRAPLLLAPDAPQSMADVAASMMIESVRMPSYDWACHSMADTDHTDRLAQIDVPTLVVIGEFDGITPLRSSERLASGIDNAQLVQIPNAGHLANQEQPLAFNDAVASFLDRIEAE